ncbi:MAG: hypothetical protein V1905_01545 [bacterium]
MKSPEESDFSVDIINDKNRLLAEETASVRWHLDNYLSFKGLGYTMRFPAGINPEGSGIITDDAIGEAIGQEMDLNFRDYQEYALEFQKVWQMIVDKCLPIAAEVYGFNPVGRLEIIPSVYGTGGGQLVTGGPVYFRIPKYRLGGGWCAEIEFIIHEILAHCATEKYREGTSIDESALCLYQWHKERLMDLLTRTILVRSGLMEKEKVWMNEVARIKAMADIDPLYYLDSENPDETKLRYEGRIRDLMAEIDLVLKGN